ncbi:hypothetical protein [Frigoribacterium sp. VKM Ac-2530]|uniref:hypothetical protein n=1 Tax=Frigoribacterium sp. VKM Ac-2530 TaxID=2783822 RepID=UPI00188C5EF2|nr:hypothetical protein [Frigoribacterium sp. VKM Ac-2530]MBF4578192.1 hypothetical protein [Frigoribacterium sp. VKM Ac-2530]
MRRRTLLLSGAGVVVLAAAVLATVVLTTGANEAEASGGGIDAPAYVATETGAPAVERDGAEAPEDRVQADAVPFADTVDYPDGLTVTTEAVDQGTVTATGSGVVTGAPYVVFSVTVHNGTDADVDLTSVVPSLRAGSDAVPSAPLYDDVDVSDLDSVVAAGADVTARYAFVVPEDRRDQATLYLDLDGVHAPATFTGSLPR